MPQDLQRLSFEWVMRTGDRHAIWKVLMVGSVWWCPSINIDHEWLIKFDRAPNW